MFSGKNRLCSSPCPLTSFPALLLTAESRGEILGSSKACTIVATLTRELKVARGIKVVRSSWGPPSNCHEGAQPLLHIFVVVGETKEISLKSTRGLGGEENSDMLQLWER